MRLLHKRTTGKASAGGAQLLTRRSASVLLLTIQGLLILTLVFTGDISSASAAATHSARPAVHTGQAFSNPQDARLQQLIQRGRLAPTVHVVASLAPTVIEQFPLVPSGIKQAFPNATGLVTIVEGAEVSSTFDTVTVDVQNMPPNITFTIFLIQFSGKPFGNVEYVADLQTRSDGSGETIFQSIVFDAFSMDARSPGSSQNKEGDLTSGTNLEHMGMWFSSLKDAIQVLNNDSLQGTIFDGGNPPLHAGPQAMTDGQTAPVF